MEGDTDLCDSRGGEMGSHPSGLMGGQEPSLCELNPI